MLGVAMMDFFEEVCGFGKETVSHSTIEKQRRARINALIDQLRELVPTQAGTSRPESLETKRPKHVVLADTITLLKQLKEKVAAEEAELQRLKKVQQEVEFHQLQVSSANTQHLLHVGQNMKRDEAPDSLGYNLPRPPSVRQASGVIVEEGKENSMYIKINCRDRRGLLVDITNSLRALPLVVRSAAITTTKDGHVYDVFEVVVEDPEVTPTDLQCLVHDALYSRRLYAKRVKFVGSPDREGNEQLDC